MQYQVPASTGFSWMIIVSPLERKLKVVDRDRCICWAFSSLLFFPLLLTDEGHGTHLVTMGRKSHLLGSDLVSFLVGLRGVFVVRAVMSVMWQGMDRQKRDPFLVFLCFLSSLDLISLSLPSTVLEQHKIICILKLFILFPSVYFLYRSPSHFNSVVSLKSFHLDPGTFQLIFSVHNFSHFKGKPA